MNMKFKKYILSFPFDRVCLSQGARDVVFTLLTVRPKRELWIEVPIMFLGFGSSNGV